MLTPSNLQNRKLRHLEGISLRNLSLSRPSPQPRGKTIDDDSLPHALKTPTKALAQRETHKLEHSRSSSDLKSSHPTQSLNGNIHLHREQVNLTRSPEKKRRPEGQKLRRRSTLNWTNAPLETRQKKLEDVVTERLADTFFSLHCSEVEDPIYVSEIIESALNPSFRFFDLNIYGPWITRRDELTIKYWAKTRNSADYLLLIELQVHLRSLQFIGKTVRPLGSSSISSRKLKFHSLKAFTTHCPGIVYSSISPTASTRALPISLSMRLFQPLTILSQRPPTQSNQPLPLTP